ncbi:helix-turn-helix domain-containing protein [Ruminiclostridium cellobioparum]|uniref:helix-turn-helix domain-containing protein n=1 Tax=Ruminiclostridium cellobioparum TaxID=29355 RepID=UPI00047F2958
MNYVISGELITYFGEKKITFGSGTYNEISEISGFSSQYYFSRLFKEKYGVSPGIYRKMILKQPE